MTIDTKTVDNIAHLARLQVATDKREPYASEMSQILDFVATMSNVDTDNIIPMAHPFDASQRLREDSVTEENQRDAFQSIAPKTENGLYLVPKVID